MNFQRKSEERTIYFSNIKLPYNASLNFDYDAAKNFLVLYRVYIEAKNIIIN